MDSNLQTLVANVGFPIAISMYLLVRIEGKLSCLSDSINELSKNILSLKWVPGAVLAAPIFFVINILIIYSLTLLPYFLLYIHYSFL